MHRCCRKSRKSLPCLQRKLCGSAACFAPCKTCHSRCCHDLCKQYVPQRCELLDKAPYVCTGCTKQNHCRKQHAYYSAYKADKKSRTLLSESRKNIHASEEQTARLNELFTPLVLNGQSVISVFTRNKPLISVHKNNSRLIQPAVTLLKLFFYFFDIGGFFGLIRAKIRCRSASCFSRSHCDLCYYLCNCFIRFHDIPSFA